MKTLVIAEKPSVARDLAAVLGRFKKQTKDFYENEDYVIASALGHVVELAMPEDIDAQLKRWSWKSLPILPQKFVLKPVEKAKDRFVSLKALMQREDIKTVVNACDAGREGELIFAYLYELAECEKTIQRLWLSSMTAQAIKESFQSLRSAQEMKSLELAARCRSEADWLVGINGTRSVTLTGQRTAGILTVGRVQTPTLTLVVEREQAIRSFVSQDYWRIGASFKIHSGEYRARYQKAKLESDREQDRIDRVWQEQEAKLILKAIQGKEAQVRETQKRTNQSAPRLYDLTTLQRESNQRFGLSAAQTLQIAQALYEKHKVITYPRTDSKALPADYPKTCAEICKNLDEPWQKFARAVLKNNWINPGNKKIFNASEVSDHFAIVPTGHKAILSGLEARLYESIVRRFLAVFYPAAEYDVTTRLSKIEEHVFKTEGKVLSVPGWLLVYEKEENAKGESLPALSEKDQQRAQLLTAEVEHDQTLPPARYTDATLLAAMEGARKFVEDEEIAEALREKGIGTPATRAQIIEHLIQLNYMKREGKELVPQFKAERLIKFIKDIQIDVLTSPALTGEWEHRLRQVESGTLTREAFMSGILQLTQTLVERTRSFQEDSVLLRETQIISPTDDLPMVETFRAFRSQDGKLIIYKIIANRTMREEEVAKLVKEKTIGPLNGFVSKMGREFSAELKLDDSLKIRFIFNSDSEKPENAEEAIIDWANANIMGPCPLCGNDVYEGANTYVCGNSKNEKKPCSFRLTKFILSRFIPEEQVTKLLKQKKTDLLDRFKSKKTGKFFGAYLLLKDNGSIGFEFVQKKSTSKKPAAKGKKEKAPRAKKTANSKAPKLKKG